MIIVLFQCCRALSYDVYVLSKAITNSRSAGLKGHDLTERGLAVLQRGTIYPLTSSTQPRRSEAHSTLESQTHYMTSLGTAGSFTARRNVRQVRSSSVLYLAPELHSRYSALLAIWTLHP